MNIQIYGKAKCFSSKSAERFFKERKIKFQYINLAEKGLSMRELDNFIAAVGNIDLLIDVKSPLYISLNIANIRAIEFKKGLIVANPMLLLAPLVRECESRKCTVGAAENAWRSWIK